MSTPNKCGLRPRRPLKAGPTYSDFENSLSDRMDVDVAFISQTTSDYSDYNELSRLMEPSATEFDDDDTSLEESGLSPRPTKRRKVSSKFQPAHLYTAFTELQPKLRLKPHQNRW